jgi:hypothetical protein
VIAVARSMSQHSHSPSTAEVEQPSLIQDPPPPLSAAERAAAAEDAASCNIIGESIVSLMLQLHSKYSGKPDSYLPPASRQGISVTPEYTESRVGDACFFIEKVLDLIVALDEACSQSVDTCRKQLWPHYHAQEAKRDEEEEIREKEEKKRKARVSQ